MLSSFPIDIRPFLVLIAFHSQIFYSSDGLMSFFLLGNKFIKYQVSSGTTTFIVVIVPLVKGLSRLDSSISLKSTRDIAFCFETGMDTSFAEVVGLLCIEF